MSPPVSCAAPAVRNTADYALDVLTRQLALLADRRGYLPPPFVSERSNDFADLLEEAARACADRGRRLLVLLDGLDEYDLTTASLDLADWLPGRPTLPRSGKAARRQPCRSRRPPSSRPSAVQLRAAHQRLRSGYRDPACRARGTRPGREDSRRIPSSPPLLSCGCRKRADGQRNVCPAETARPRRRRQRDRSPARQLPRPQSHAPPQSASHAGHRHMRLLTTRS